MRFVKVIAIVTAAGLVGWALSTSLHPAARAETPHGASAGVQAIAPADAMQRLRAGNERFVDQKQASDHRDASRRMELAGGQHPFAVVLGCADSRVPPELVFDQGLGDLFVIRVAGEVAPPEVIGSVEYAVEHLGCRTIIVLGHEKCGAVEAALNAADGPAPHGNVGALIKEILPSIEKIDRHSPDALDAAVRANARGCAGRLVAGSQMLAQLAGKGEVVITPARYDLETGRVEFMDQVGGAAKH